MDEQRFRRIWLAEVARNGIPKSQYAACRACARVTVKLVGAPQSPFAVIDAAAAMAKDLFGRAFERASFGQQITWIDMCERALLRAMMTEKRR